MIAHDYLSDRIVAGRSMVFSAGNYLKNVLNKRRCRDCSGSGGHTCSHCQGMGIVAGDGSSVFRDPCRRCIGSGREECHVCGGAGSVAQVPVLKR